MTISYYGHAANPADSATVKFANPDAPLPITPPSGMATGDLVGHDQNRIVASVETLLADEVAYRHMSRGASPYGDGQAAARIVRIVGEKFAAP